MRKHPIQQQERVGFHEKSRVALAIIWVAIPVVLFAACFVIPWYAYWKGMMGFRVTRFTSLIWGLSLSGLYLVLSYMYHDYRPGWI